VGKLLAGEAFVFLNTSQYEVPAVRAVVNPDHCIQLPEAGTESADRGPSTEALGRPAEFENKSQVHSDAAGVPVLVSRNSLTLLRVLPCWATNWKASQVAAAFRPRVAALKKGVPRYPW
jgi:hypothetical protein